MLGANDGIVSVAALRDRCSRGQRVATHAARHRRRLAGLIGRRDVDGHRRVRVGVSSQRDTEEADQRAEEAAARGQRPHGRAARVGEDMHENRGVEPGLARLVAEQLMAHDELGAHMRDEIGITEVSRRPADSGFGRLGACLLLAASLPLIVAVTVPIARSATAAVALVALVILGYVGALAGGAPLRSALRVVFWSTIAMTVRRDRLSRRPLTAPWGVRDARGGASRSPQTRDRAQRMCQALVGVRCSAAAATSASRACSPRAGTAEPGERARGGARRRRAGSETRRGGRRGVAGELTVNVHVVLALRRSSAPDGVLARG